MSNPQSTDPNLPPPPSIDYQSVNTLVDRDVEHLKILSICWYVASGLAAFMGCVPIIHVSLGLMLILNPGRFAGGGGGVPQAFMGWLFLLLGCAVMLVAWTGAILGFLTALSLPQRRRLILCYVAAAIFCLQMPIGTVLGVFTFIVLSRPGVKASFH